MSESEFLSLFWTKIWQKECLSGRTNRNDCRRLWECNQILGKTNYAALQSGAIEINGHKVRTAPLSSLAKAREIADLLKSWIQKGEFLLTEPVRPMPVQASLNGLKAIED